MHLVSPSSRTPPIALRTPSPHSALLTLPSELLNHILSYLIQPKNNRIYLFVRLVPGISRAPPPAAPPRLVLRLLSTDDLSTSSTQDQNGETDEAEEDQEDQEDKVEDEIADNFIQTRHSLFAPPTLTLTRLFHTLTLHYMHTHLLLHVKLGHQLAADVTIQSRHCLRQRKAVVSLKNEMTETDRQKKQQHQAYRSRLKATLQTAHHFRRILVSMHMWSAFAKTLPGQLDGVLEALVMGAEAARQSRSRSVTTESDTGTSTFCRSLPTTRFDIGSKRAHYIVVDLTSWAVLSTHNWYWGRRRGVAVDLLRLLQKWRRKDIWRRLAVDIRGERSLPDHRLWCPDTADEDDMDMLAEEARSELFGKRMKKVVEEFGKEFVGRMIVKGVCEWDSSPKEVGEEDHEEEGGAVVVI